MPRHKELHVTVASVAQVSSHAQLAGSSFFGNSAAQDGGAMHQTNSIGDVAGSNFAGNTAGEVLRQIAVH